MKHCMFALGLMLVASGAGAAEPTGGESRYAPWPGATASPAVPNAALQKLVDEAGMLLDEAQRSRAADPRFLQDLRELLSRYDWPWTVPLVRDDFADGDLTRDPAWTVEHGRFSVRPGAGLVTRAQAPEPEGGGQAGERDLGKALLGAIFDELERSKNKDEPKRGPAPTGLLRTEVAIPPAFAVQIAMDSEHPGSRLDFIVYDDAAALTGYRLVYQPEGVPALRLESVRRDGASVVAQARPDTTAKTGTTHHIEWTRNGRGRFRVKLNDQTIIETFDRSFEGPYEGFALRNQSGDHIVRSVAVYGAR